ncbi:MAG: hypothetical protein ACI4V7_02920 [Succinivibrionaceae bacterium]
MKEISSQRDVDLLKNLSLTSSFVPNFKTIRVKNIAHLYLKITKSIKSLSISFIFRYSVNKKTTYISLGSINKISLKKAIQITNFYNSKILHDRIEKNFRKNSFTSDNTISHSASANEQDCLFKYTANYAYSHYNNNFSDYSFTINTVKTSETWTLIELLDDYVKNHNLKPKTIKAYKTTINYYCSDYFNIPINKIDFDELVNQIELKHTVLAEKSNPNKIKTNEMSIKEYKNNNKKHQLRILCALLNWAIANKQLTYNPLKNAIATCINTPVKHRKALNCESFENISMAKRVVKKFIISLKEQLPDDFFTIWILHLILGTRVSETYRVIATFTNILNNKKISKNKYLTISVKTTKNNEQPNYRIPLTPITIFLLNKLIHISTRYNEESFARSMNRSIPEKFKDKMSVHGSRALFRTIVEFLNLKKISITAIEYYLSHKTLNYVQSCYHRNDLIDQRREIQLIYGQWIMNLAGIKIE